MAIDFADIGGSILGNVGSGILGGVIGGLFEPSEEEKASLRSKAGAAGAKTGFEQSLAEAFAFDPAFAIKRLLEGRRLSNTLNNPTVSLSGESRGSAIENDPSLQKVFDALRNPATYNLMARDGGGFTFTPPNFSPTFLDDKGGFSGGGPASFNVGGTGGQAVSRGRQQFNDQVKDMISRQGSFVGNQDFGKELNRFFG